MITRLNVKHFYYILTSAMLAVSLQSCQNEDVVFEEDSCRIVLNMSSEGTFLETDTRAVQSLTDLEGFSFKLSGTDHKGEAVDRELRFQKDGDLNIAIVPAGQYTLTAGNETMATTGNGMPYYHGSSELFKLSDNTTTVVSIALGKPHNARIDLVLDNTFSSLYTLEEVSFDDKVERSITLTSQGSVYAMVPADGIVTYTVKATAKKGSHVSDLPATGVKGTIKVAPGNSYTLNLTAKAISDLIIGIGDGEHGGEFD